jgi:hypothetical protein
LRIFILILRVFLSFENLDNDWFVAFLQHGHSLLAWLHSRAGNPVVCSSTSVVMLLLLLSLSWTLCSAQLGPLALLMENNAQINSNQRQHHPGCNLRGCFIYILDSSNSRSIIFWSSQLASSSRSNWTGIWTGQSYVALEPVTQMAVELINNHLISVQ